MAINPEVKQEILAENLDITTYTLKTHLTNIRDKLAVKNSAATVTKAKEAGIIR